MALDVEVGDVSLHLAVDYQFQAGVVAADLFHNTGAALDGRAAGDVEDAEFYGRAAGVERQDELVRREAACRSGQRPRAADEEHFFPLVSSRVPRAPRSNGWPQERNLAPEAVRDVRERFKLWQLSCSLYILQQTNCNAPLHRS